MDFSDLNLSRKWFLSFVTEMSNNEKERVRDLNQYANRQANEMQIALGVTHDMYTVLDELEELLANPAADIQAIETNVNRLQIVVKRDVKKIKSIKNFESQNTIDGVKEEVVSVYMKIKILKKYVSLEKKGYLIKDKNGNLRASSKLAELANIIENYPKLFALTIISLLLIFLIVIALFNSDYINPAENMGTKLLNKVGV